MRAKPKQMPNSKGRLLRTPKFITKVMPVMVLALGLAGLIQQKVLLQLYSPSTALYCIFLAQRFRSYRTIKTGAQLNKRLIRVLVLILV